MRMLLLSIVQEKPAGTRDVLRLVMRSEKEQVEKYHSFMRRKKTPQGHFSLVCVSVGTIRQNVVLLFTAGLFFCCLKEKEKSDDCTGIPANSKCCTF